MLSSLTLVDREGRRLRLDRDARLLNFPLRVSVLGPANGYLGEGLLEEEARKQAGRLIRAAQPGQLEMLGGKCLQLRVERTGETRILLLGSRGRLLGEVCLDPSDAQLAAEMMSAR